MRKIEMFGKRVPIIAIFVMVLMIGIAAAALVTTFAEHKTDVKVSAPVGLGSYNHSLSLFSGENNTGNPITINVINYANVTTNATIVTTINSTDHGNNSDGICVHYKYNSTVVTNISIPANSTLDLFMYIRTDPALAPDNYTITTNFTPSYVPCVTTPP